MEVSNQAFARKLTAFETKEEFFAYLATHLAKTLDVTHILIGYLTTDGHHVRTVALHEKGSIAENIQYPLEGSVCENVVGKTFCDYADNVQSLFPEDAKLAVWDIESYAGLPLFDRTGKPLGLIAAMHANPMHNLEFIECNLRIVAVRVEAELEEFLKKKKEPAPEEKPKVKSALELLLETSKTIASEVELEKVVQKITDAATELSGAQFGAFFYNVENEEGEIYRLYTISGVSKDNFSQFLMPRNTKVFAPTFAGYGTVRYDDVTQQKYFGKNAPYYGMPEGHLPVKSYLAVPVISPSTKEVIGGLFFGHPQPGIFTEEAEEIVEGIAAQGAIAMENARLFEQQKKTEQKLRRSESKFRQLSGANVIGVAFWKMQGEITEANDAFLDFLGYTREELEAGKLNWKKLTLPEHEEIHSKGVQRALKGEVVIPYETRYIHKSGEILSALLGYSMQEGCEDQGIAFVLDITEKKKTEWERDLLSSLVETSSDFIGAIDIHMKTIFLNKGGQKIVGLEEGEATSKKIQDYYTPEDFEQIKREMLPVLRRKGYWEGFSHFRHFKTGKKVPVSLAAFPVKDKDTGKILGIASVARDITKQREIEKALEEAKKKLEIALNAAAIGTWTLDVQKNRVVADKNFANFFGTDPEVVAKGVPASFFADAIYPEDISRLKKLVEEAMKSGKNFEAEYRVSGPDRKYRWVLARGQVEYDDMHRPLYFSGTLLDIHERKLAEEALIEQKLQYESIFNSTSDAILIFDYEGYLIKVNPAALKMHGYEYDELIGQHVKILIHPESHHSFSDFVTAVNAGKQYFVAGKHVKKDGSSIDIEVVGTGFIYKGTPHLLAVVRDVTEHKKREVALHHKEETLRLAVEATGLGTWDFNPCTGKMNWSDRCKALFGLPPDAYVDYNIFLQRLHPDDRERVNKLVQWVLNPESGGKYDTEYRTIAEEKWIKATGETFFNEEGQAVRFIGTVLDITAQKLRQQELMEKTRALEFANEDLRNFTYTISHDIKNPLSSLLFAASVSEDFEAIEEFREIMPLIEKSSKKIDEILKGLVEIIKEEETKGKEEFIDIAEVIAEVKSELAEAIAENSCAITTTLHTKEIRFIRSYLQSILRNLIDNAIKYKSPERPPEISISVQGYKQRTEFIISDNGMGIDLKKHKKNLFQPFKRFNEDLPGTGIGLFMIKRIVEKYGGNISIESQPGMGTTFYISIDSINPASDNYQHPNLI